MKYFVAYVFERGFGNMTLELGHTPPTIEDIRDAEEQLMTYDNLEQKPIIINFIPLSD